MWRLQISYFPPEYFPFGHSTQVKPSSFTPWPQVCEAHTKTFFIKRRFQFYDQLLNQKTNKYNLQIADHWHSNCDVDTHIIKQWCVSISVLRQSDITFSKDKENLIFSHIRFVCGWRSRGSLRMLFNDWCCLRWLVCFRASISSHLHMVIPLS